MRTSPRSTGLLAAVALLLCLVATTSGCAPDGEGAAAEPTPRLMASRAVYASVSALADAADTVVRGRVTGVIAREGDDGGSAGGASLPVVLYSFAVTEVVGGDDVAGQIPIVWSDTDLVEMSGVSPLDGSGELLLFLEHQTSATDAPGIDSVEEFYTPLSGDNGVFDVATSGDVATARSEVVRALVASRGTGHGGDRTWPLAAVLRAAGERG